MLSPGIGDDHDVFAGKGDEGFIQTKPFPETPLDPISFYGSPETLLNHQSQSMVRKPVQGDVDPEMASPQPLATPLDLLIVGGGAQPLVRLESEKTQGQRFVSRGGRKGRNCS